MKRTAICIALALTGCGTARHTDPVPLERGAEAERAVNVQFVAPDIGTYQFAAEFEHRKDDAVTRVASTGTLELAQIAAGGVTLPETITLSSFESTQQAGATGAFKLDRSSPANPTWRRDGEPATKLDADALMVTLAVLPPLNADVRARWQKEFSAEDKIPGDEWTPRQSEPDADDTIDWSDVRGKARFEREDAVLGHACNRVAVVSAFDGKTDQGFTADSVIEEHFCVTRGGHVLEYVMVMHVSMEMGAFVSRDVRTIKMRLTPAP